MTATMMVAATMTLLTRVRTCTSASARRRVRITMVRLMRPTTITTTKMATAVTAA